MRPDEHKAKASRRYQSKHKKQGDTTALEVAQARRAAAKAKIAGNSLNAIRRRNAESDQASQTVSVSSELNDTTTPTKTFSRRKIASNQDRYEEKSEQGLLTFIAWLTLSLDMRTNLTFSGRSNN